MKDNQQNITAEVKDKSAGIPERFADFSMNEQLVKNIQEGNREDIETLWKQNQGIVRWVLKKHFGFVSKQDMEDMSQQAFIGFLEAVRYYNPDRGMKFSNYLINRIRKNVYRYFDNCYMIRIPEYMRNRIIAYKRAEKDLEVLGKMVTDKAIMEKTGMHEEAFKATQKAIEKLQVNSSDMELNTDGNKASTLLDMVEATEKTEEQAMECIYLKELHNVLTAAIETLPENQRVLIVEKYWQGLGTKRIAEINGCSRQYIHQQLQDAFKTIRQGEYREELLSFLPEYIVRKEIDKEQVAAQLNMTESEKAFLV